MGRTAGRRVGSADRPLDRTVASALIDRAEADPAAVYLHGVDGALSYGRVAASAEAMAASLANLDVAKGDRIAVVLPGCPEFVVAAFAAARLGAVIVPVNVGLTGSELRYVLRHSGAVCAVSVETFAGVDHLQLFEDFLVELPDLRHLVTVGRGDLWYDDRIYRWEDLLSAGRGKADGSAARPKVRADDVFAILYASGSRGKPRGVELAHRNLLHSASQVADAWKLGPADALAGVGRWHQVFGLGPFLLGTALSGASAILGRDAQDGADALARANRLGASVLCGVPSLLASVLRAVERGAAVPDSLRLSVAFGAPLRDDLARRIEAALGAPLVAAYSLPEAGGVVSVGRPEDPVGKRVQTAGRPIAETAAKVVDDDGAPLPDESVGEIRVRGPGVMRGYHRQPRETAAWVDAEGFLRTGDLGMVDEDGYVHLLGRREDVVIRGGITVQPREVEERLLAHPAVAEAVALGVDDDVLGEAIHACVVTVEGGVATEAEVVAWCRAALASYKAPDVVSFVDELPLTGSGKVWRHELRRRVLSARARRSSGADAAASPLEEPPRR